MIDASKYTQTQVADNEVTIAGVSFGKLTDTDAERIIAIIRGMQSGAEPGNARTQAQASKPEPKREYEPATDVTLPITVTKCTKTQFAFTLGYGGGRAGAKLLIREAGFAWNADLKAYAGTPKQAEALGLALAKGNATLKVSAASVQAGRDKAAAKAERKAKRA